MRMVTGKLDCCISTCSFPVDTYVHIITSMYGDVQILYCIVFLGRHFKLKVFVYLIDFMYNYSVLCFTLIRYDYNIIHISLIIYYFLTIQLLFHVCFL